MVLQEIMIGLEITQDLVEEIQGMLEKKKTSESRFFSDLLSNKQFINFLRYNNLHVSLVGVQVNQESLRITTHMA